MGLFRKLYTENAIFSEKKKKDFKLVLQVESIKDDYIISYLNNNIKRTTKINKKDIDKYVFLEKTGNFFYKKFEEVDPTTLISEEGDGGGMTTGDAGVGGTADSQFSSDFYAPDDARNLFGHGEGGSKHHPNKKKKKKKKKKLNKNDPNFPVVKRPKIDDVFLKQKS